MSLRLTLIAGLAGAALLTALGTGVWLYGKAQYRAGHAAAQAEHHVAELEAWRETADRIQAVANDLHTTTLTLRAATPGLLEAYTRETLLAPLPADCVPGVGRLRSINDAVRAANAASGTGPVVQSGAGNSR